MRCLARRVVASSCLYLGLVRVMASDPSYASNADVCVGSCSCASGYAASFAAGQSLLQLRRGRQRETRRTSGRRSGASQPTSPLCAWDPYSECTQRCGGGLKSRIRHCANGTELETVVECNTFECGPECELKPWLEWGDCSQTCGVGTKTRGRAVIVDPENGGTDRTQCANTWETIPCHVQDCPLELADAAASSPWGSAFPASPNPSSLAAILDPASSGGAPNPHPRLAECPGGPVVVAADEGACGRRGGSLMRNPDDETDFQSLEDFFGDNKLMRSWKFVLEDCVEDKDTETCEIADTSDKRFKVGTTRVRVEGSDLAGNKNACLLSIHVVDTESPTFGPGLSALDEKLTTHLSDSACSASAEFAFTEYEQRGNSVVATDNCDKSVEIVKQIMQDGRVIYDSRHDMLGRHSALLGPGKYEMVFTAIDDYSSAVGVFHAGRAELDVSPRNASFSVGLSLEDKSPPHTIVDCPRSTTVTIKPHHTAAIVQWKLPHALDNCEGALPPIEQSEPQKHPGMHFPVGVHTVTYAFMDAAGNRMASECEFVVHIKPKADPVAVDCPGDVSVSAVPDAAFGLVFWPAPVAAEGSKVLGASHVSYPQGLESGIAFPYGTTTVLVLANGTREGEETASDECTFSVTVTDNQRPMLDGQRYRCLDESSLDVRPFGICDGMELNVSRHGGFATSHKYDVIGATRVPPRGCCTSEDNVEHECVPVAGPHVTYGNMASHYSPPKYCKPKTR